MNYYRIILLSLILFAVAVTNASAVDFNRTFNQTDIVHYNTSVNIAGEGATPSQEWHFLAWLGIDLFILACVLSMMPEAHEIDAVLSGMSCFPLGISALTATSVMQVTGTGVASGIQVLSGQNYNVWVLLENHTIYHFDLTSIMLWIFTVIAVLNTIRIILNHRRLEQAITP